MMSLVASSASSTDKFTRLLDRSKESPKAVKQLTRLFPNWVCQYNFLSLKYGLNILQGTEGENKKSKKLLKNTLKELDMLPPQRPELFSKGQLAKLFNVDNVGFHNVKSSMEWPCEGFKGLCSYWHAL
ncbi:hypothetical protein Ahy_B06g080382 isoform B [Arachis hypogaea]|uniref:Uncharacterized protein n=1 Tax=Arachis hypogaea TaxID=3818 RepID=A0A444YHU5_ARAHY|nr:hypothetical protein Ahy_B06g080382 isoform B [Arachis hypogaea]